MADLSPLVLIKSSIDDVRTDFKNFLNEYHSETLKIWLSITIVQKDISTIVEKQGASARFWGIIGGAIPATIAICTGLLWYIIKK